MSTSMLSRMQKVELLKQIARNPNIPSPPTVILKVLEKASTPDCTIADLCKIIQVDAGLSGKILRIVNSALFGLPRPVTSIQRALAVVGVNSARLLVLAIALPEMNQQSKLTKEVAQRYWKSSITGAIVAHELALRIGSRDPEDDMAAGLLRDTGELVLQQVFPDNAQEIAREPAQALVHDQCEVEENHYGLHHAEVSAFILDRWRLPADMTEAIRWHHGADQGKFSTPRAEGRAYLMDFATRATLLMLYQDDPLIFTGLCTLAKERFQMNEEELLEFLRPLGAKTADFAALLQVDIGEASNFNAARIRASEELVHLTVAASLDNHRAECEAEHWKQEAVFDPLTRLFNRRFLDTKLEEFFEKSKAQGLHFGVLFIDLDGFKPLNDQFGHAFGDVALQEVGECLHRSTRQVDIVARFGGDEFCILAEAMEEKELKVVGQRILTALNALVIRQGPNEGHIGASIGAVCCNPGTAWATADELLAGADQAMYLAKSRGKNQVAVVSFPKE